MKLRHKYYFGAVITISTLIYFKTAPQEFSHSTASKWLLLLIMVVSGLTYWIVLGFILYRKGDLIFDNFFKFLKVINLFTMTLIFVTSMIVIFINSDSFTLGYVIGFLLALSIPFMLLLGMLIYMKKIDFGNSDDKMQ